MKRLQKEIIIYYHDNCYDGFTSAWIAHKYFNNLKIKNIKYYNINYDSKLHLHKDSLIFFLDIVPDIEELKKLEKRNLIIVLDHHKSSLERIKIFTELLSKDINSINLSDKGVFYHFNMLKSGASLTWDFFNPNKEASTFIKYIEDRDLIKNELKSINEVTAYIKSFNYSFESWNALSNELNNDLKGAIQRGSKLIEREKIIIAMIAEKAKEYKVKIEDKEYNCVIVNTTSHWTDLGIHLLSVYPNIDFSLAYTINEAKNQVQFSFRSKELDVAEIAKHINGGGHKHASGALLPLNEGLSFLQRLRSSKDS